MVRSNKFVDNSFKPSKTRCKEFISKYLNLNKIKESQIDQLSNNFYVSRHNIIKMIDELTIESTKPLSKRKRCTNIVRIIK